METLQLPLDGSNQEKLECAYELVNNVKNFNYFEYQNAVKVIRSFHAGKSINNLHLNY